MFDWITLADRHGVLTLHDVQAAGISRAAWYRAIHCGDLVSPFPATAFVSGAPPTRERDIATAVRSIRGSLASHRSAIDLWTGTGQVGDPVDLIVGRSCGAQRRPGVVVHRPRDRADLQPSHWRGIRCTGPLRALLDLGAVDAGRVGAALTGLVINRLISVAAVEATITRHSIQGRDGIGAVEEALRRWPLGDEIPDSALEVHFARLLSDARVGDFSFHLVVNGAEVDFAFPRERLVVETDGWEFHGTREAFETDRRRDAELIAAGWRVMRFTWRQVTEQPKWAIQMVEAALRH